MRPSYKKEKDNDYMILEAPGKPEGSEYQIRMLLVNKISGLLDCKMRKMDGAAAFYYDITERQPMTKAFERQLMGKQDIEKLLRGLERAMDESERYLLVMEQFILKPDYIFRSIDTGEFAFCYLPFYDGSLEEDFRELAEYILKRLDHSQEEAVLWGYDIYSRSVEEHFSLGKILESVHERVGREAAKQGQIQSRASEEVEYLNLEEEEETISPIEKTAVGMEKAPEREHKKESIPAGETAEKEPYEKEAQKERKESDREIQKKRWRTEEKKRGKRRQKKNSVQTRAELRGRRGQVGIIFLGMLASFGAAAWAVWSQGLNFIQAGGILFLCMGLLVYFITVFQKKPKKQRESVEDELFGWEMPSEDDQERTVFLGKPLSEEFPVLVSMDPENQANVVLDKSKMMVGKQKDQVDIFFADFSVSRIHASIEKEKERWYLRDLGSTNGTYVDGERLMDGERRELCGGEEVRFSNLRFYFHREEAVTKQKSNQQR